MVWCHVDVPIETKFINVALQMAQSNVGSLLVFDPTKVSGSKEVTSAAADAVVGIVTERGKLIEPGTN